MKKILNIIFVLCLVIFTGCATAPQADDPGFSGSSVWRVSRGSSIMYLAGSIHILREGDFPFPAAFDYAFSASDVLVLEADIGQMEDPAIVEYLMSQMLLEEGQSLQSVLSPEAYQLLSEKLMYYGVPIEFLSNLKPSMIMTLLSVLHLEGRGFTQEGIDHYYYRRASEENVPIRFLESVESQIHLLVSMGDGYEDDYILYSLMEMENTENNFDVLLDDWRRGEGSNSEIELQSMRDEWPLLYRALITNRHDSWMPQILAFLESGLTHFVIAGFLHIYGPDGLLQLLEEQGYTVEQLTGRS